MNHAHRTALVTGASGYVGGLLVPCLLERGYAVRVLTRSGSLDVPWTEQVEVVQGDAHDAGDLRRALQGVDGGRRGGEAAGGLVGARGRVPRA